ncbi:hypothetical protein Ancab_032813 [Ancistrocladus abbreviatus]
MSSAGQASVSHGWISAVGRRRQMEDTVTVVPRLVAGEYGVYDFFAVYDGHGGVEVADKCRDRLHCILAEDIAAETPGGRKEINWEKVMAGSFARMDEEVHWMKMAADMEGSEGSSMAPEKTMGSTAVVVLVGSEELVVANCGDCRAVLSRGGVAIPLSRDHKPDRPDETERVEAAGGRVLNWNGCRVLGVLATSRSIEITVCRRSQSDDFLIIASDGLWDVLSNEAACEFVRRCFNGQMWRRLPSGVASSSASAAAILLAQLAIARGSGDNISAIVVELRRSTNYSTTT